MEKSINGDAVLDHQPEFTETVEPPAVRLARAVATYAQTVVISQSDAKATFHYNPADEVVQRKLLHIQVQLLTDMVTGVNGEAFLVEFAKRVEAEIATLRKPRIAMAVKGALQ